MQDLIPAIKYHTERYDGTGQPEGLAGDNIPLDARILAVAKGFAERFDGSESRQAIKKALMELQKDAGKRYDKSLVQALIIAYRSGHLFAPPAKLKL